MVNKNFAFETDVLIQDKKFFKDDKEHTYDVYCYNGFGIGMLSDDEDTTAPKRILLTYPKRERIVKSNKLSGEVLEYRGLFDLGAKDITYGDIMMLYGEIVPKGKKLNIGNVKIPNRYRVLADYIFDDWFGSKKEALQYAKNESDDYSIVEVYDILTDTYIYKHVEEGFVEM